MKKRFFTQLTKMLFITASFVLINNYVSIGQYDGDFRSIANGNWNATTTWETYNGILWNAAVAAPSSTNNVYIQSGDTVYLTQNESCNNLVIANSTTSTLGVRGIVSLATFTLNVNGRLRAYWAPVNTVPGTSSTSGFTGYPFLANATTPGKISIVGDTRSLTSAGEWGAAINNPGQGTFPVEVNLNAGQTITMGTNFKCTSFNIINGTLDMASTTIGLDYGTANSGDFTIGTGAVVKSSGSSSNIFQRTANQPAGTLTINGTLILKGASPKFQMTSYNFSNGTVQYDLAGGQIFATKGTGTTSGNIPLAYGNIILSNSGTKTLIASQTTSITGTLSLQGTALLALGTSSVLSYEASSTLEYAGNGTQTSTLAEFPATGVNNLIINNPNQVIIDASKTITGNATVYPLSNLTLNTSQTLTVGGNFLIQSDATGTGSFIDNGALSVTGSSTVQKYLTGAGGADPNGNYWYIGSPVANAQSGVFNAMGDNKLWSYSEVPTQGYSEINVNGVNLTPLQGFVARLGATSTINFTGALNTGSIGSTDNLTRSAVSIYDGFNLVSNPYPSAINFDNTGLGLTRTNLENTVWYRSGGNFATYNWSTGIGSPVTTTQYVPAMQAFWVLVSPGQTNGTLIVDNPARVHNSQAFYKKLTSTTVFRMEARRDVFTDEAVVCFFPSALETYENYDSQKMFSTDPDYPQIYTLTSDNVNVAINGESLLSASEDRVVPIGFKTSVSGQHSFVATNLTDFDPSISVYLEDTQLSVLQDMRLNNTYTFTSGVVDDAARFKMHFGTLATGIASTENETSSIYSANNTVYVKINNSLNSTIEVFDLLGKKIISQCGSKGLNIIQTKADMGIYIVKLTNNDQVITKKITLAN